MHDLLNRLEKEILMYDPIDGITVGPVGDDLLHWQATIHAFHPPHQGGIFNLDIHIPEHYPYRPPLVVFKTRIYHPNINSVGEISMDLLEDEWCIAMTIQKVVLSIASILPDPLLEEPLEPEIAHIYKTDRDRYNQTAREWTQRYAM